MHCSELSLARFRREFCVPALPVVITGLGPHLTEDGERGAELGWLRRHGATKKVAVTRDNAHVNSTLACADTDVLNLGDHLDRVLSLDRPNLDPSHPEFGRQGRRRHLPLRLRRATQAPSLAGAIRVPRYFAHDFLQRTRYTHAFTASWPSLFVAAPHTRSSLHVDQWQGNFWMAMVKGTKRWTLFHADDVGLCSPDYSRGTLDPAFPHLHVMDDARRRAKREEGDASGGVRIRIPRPGPGPNPGPVMGRVSAGRILSFRTLGGGTWTWVPGRCCSCPADSRTSCTIST